MRTKETTVHRLQKHDVVFGSPINDPTAGMPIGDGDLGSLVWMEQDGLHIHVNKTDLWADDTQNDEVFCSSETENLTALRHGGEIVVKFSTPVFDCFYQKQFDGRISLADATANLLSETPFSTIRARAFASNKNKVTVLSLDYDFAETDDIEITLTRYGSRNFWRWYAFSKQDATIGLDGTETRLDGDFLFIRQTLNATKFCLGLCIQAHTRYEAKAQNSHTLKARFTDEKKGGFTLFYTIALGETLDEAQARCQEILTNAQKIGEEQIYVDHKADWENFWNQSFVHISDDYLENLWYLSLYYSNSECRGAYPPHFTSGIWGFRHDYLPWAHYFHYNMQHIYAPLEASGHGDLVENYFRMRLDGLPYARKYAEKVKGKKGAFYHDVVDRHGKGFKTDAHNHTPGAEIALSAYRHYKMNGDFAFLQNTALPIMQGSAELYLDVFQKESDGLYHIHNATPYEGNVLLSDTLTDICAVKALFSALCELPNDLVPPTEKAKYQDVLSHLPDYQFADLEQDECADDTILLGNGSGEKVQGQGKVLTVGTDENGNRVRRTFGDIQKGFDAFPDTEFSPLYPSGVVGLKDKNTEVFHALHNTLLLHRHPKDCIQWCMMPLYIARLGDAQRLFPYLREVASAWLRFPNGFSMDCYAGRDDLTEYLKYNRVINVDTGAITLVAGRDFRHFDMEGLPIIANAINEALLQSYDGTIRLFPCIEQADDARFSLFAEGGFSITADKQGENIQAEITSLRGENCILILPDYTDLTAVRFAKNGTPFQPTFQKTQAETQIILTPYLQKGDTVEVLVGTMKDVYPQAERNTDFKSCGQSQLGSPKNYN